MTYGDFKSYHTVVFCFVLFSFLFQGFYDIILVRREGRIANRNRKCVCSYEYNCIVLYCIVFWVGLSHAPSSGLLIVLSRLLALGRSSVSMIDCS